MGFESEILPGESASNRRKPAMPDDFDVITGPVPPQPKAKLR
jgi:hypothetical protein